MPDMDSIVQVLVSAITLGGIYAVSALGLALLWGVMGMLNMAHGSLMAIGAYTAVFVVSQLGLPWFLGAPAAILIGGLAGWLLYQLTVRWTLKTQTFETTIIVATVGVAITVKSLLLIVFSGYPKRQPFSVEGGVYIGKVLLPFQSMLIVAVTITLTAVLTLALNHTRAGRAIRATAQNPRAAALMGIPAERVFLQVLVIAGVLASISGVLVSSVANVSPTTGDDAMLKVFVICVVAGLGYIPGTIAVAFAMALFEVTIQYSLSAKWGYPLMLCAAVLILIRWPAGIFGAERVARS
jgi:branched-chain amino acid transport system permease protein